MTRVSKTAAAATAVVPGPARDAVWTRALLGAGVAAAGVYVVGDVVAGLLYAGYRFEDQWISELTARGSPVRPVMVGVLTAHGLLLAVLGVGVWRSAGRRGVLRAVGSLLIASAGVGFFVHVVFPMSSRWMAAGFSDTMHMSLSMMWGVLTFTAMILAAVAYRGWFGLCSIATVLIMFGFGVASSIAIRGLAANDTPWAGLFERVNAYSLMVWLAALAVTAARHPASSTEEGSR
jgi:hypothetical protein